MKVSTVCFQFSRVNAAAFFKCIDIWIQVT